jgi:type II secretory pathway pseudopilin PulG
MGHAVALVPTFRTDCRTAAPALRRDAYRTFLPRHRPAYTLFELVIVTLIISIVSAVAVPRYANSVGRYRADSAARRVAADLNLARAKAKSASATRNVTFNTAAGMYTLSGVRDLDHSANPYTVNLAGAPYYVKITFADFGGVPQAQFDMYGTALWGGTVKVRTGDYERTVSLVKADGSITVQ